jgi:AcrR family transcriptional regulator
LLSITTVLRGGRAANDRQLGQHAAILQAATGTLNANPGASVEDIARAAGVSRQTVYAHFPTREALLDAVIEHATAEVTAAFDAPEPDNLPPSAALVRLLGTGWQVTARYPSSGTCPQ